MDTIGPASRKCLKQGPVFKPIGHTLNHLFFIHLVNDIYVHHILPHHILPHRLKMEYNICILV